MGTLAGKRLESPLYAFEYEPSILQAVVSLFPLKRIGFLEDKNRLLKVEAITPQGGITLLNVHAFKYGWRDRHERMGRLLFEDVRPAPWAVDSCRRLRHRPINQKRLNF